MRGFIVKHNGFGLGRIQAFQNNVFTVDFFSPPQQLSLAAFSGKKPVLRRTFLPLQTICDSPNGQCRVTGWAPAQVKTEPHEYQVEFDSGMAASLPETALTPITVPELTCPLEVLSELELDGYQTFETRETMADAWNQLVRSGLGVKALLSSRIDLRPHQAYVAGTVLLDRQQRYLLADEVGLGKTIEAGIVIHALMERRPSANILVLCPGTLAQQWLCELYSKFSGRIFQMPELHFCGLATGSAPCQWIVSFTGALQMTATLQRVKWDLVVIDEAHHLLGATRLYDLAKQLSQASPHCLLLSAIPAQHREDEYLRLLTLLEPKRYDPNAPQAKERFKALYERQIEIGRKLSYITRRLAEYTEGANGPERILSKANELTALPVLANDLTLAEMLMRLDSKDGSFAEQVRALVHYVGDQYRISRRILRNRRSQLIETEPDLRITRRLHPRPYQPEQLELDTRAAVRYLLQSLQDAGADQIALVPLARLLFQSLCDPECLSSLLALASEAPARLDEETFSLDAHISYADWGEHASALWLALQPYLDQDDFDRLARACEVWRTDMEVPLRLGALVDFLRKEHSKSPKKKFLIFAGYPGAASRLTAVLVQRFQADSVARFEWDMDDKAKEKDVQRFRRESQCWILVSDETGGEGRNFQFADELIHYDLPWHVGKIEQRIGRLDRLGRKRPEVCSNVVFTKGEEEEGLLKCLENGFEVFTRSVSGLEFALSEIEKRIVLAAIEDGYDGLDPLPGEIKAKADAERAEDDIQGMLDAASLERTSAEAFRRVQSTPERDAALEAAFVKYFSFLGGNGAVRSVRAGIYTEGIFEFRPDQVKDVTLSLKLGENGTPADRRGTFRRALAQERPDLEFFSIANEFFDAVCATLFKSRVGRSYAVECLSPCAPWRGFEFGFRPMGRHDLLKDHPGLLNHLDRVFALKVEHCFIAEDLQPAPVEFGLLGIRRGLKPEGKDTSWWNFTLKNTRIQILAERYANPGWSTLVRQAEGRARVLAHAQFSAVLEPVLQAEEKRITEQIRQLETTKADGWAEEVTALKCLLQALSEWDLQLDTAGFLSVNGGLIL